MSDTYNILSYDDVDESGKPVKYCSECIYFRFTDDVRCPCCRIKYRWKRAKQPNIIRPKPRKSYMLRRMI
jgi:hypothetical protein